MIKFKEIISPTNEDYVLVIKPIETNKKKKKEIAIDKDMLKNRLSDCIKINK